MKMNDCGAYDEIFTHIDEGTGAVMHINASAMIRNVEQHLKDGSAEACMVEMDHEYVKYVRENRGVEQWKIDRLVEPFLSMPAVGVWTPDGSCLTVDGHHRMVRWAERGDETYRIVIFSWATLALYLVTDFPEEFSEFIAGETLEQVPEDVSLAKILQLK